MILIALGANLPFAAAPPEQTLRTSLKLLSDNGAKVTSVSRFFVTPAWPDPSEPAYVNAVVMVTTALAPVALMGLMHDIETRLGRVRSKRNAARCLDLDLIDYAGLVDAGPPILPHPRMESRGFVLVPLADIAPGWVHPVSGRSVGDLIGALPPSQRTGIRTLG
ncbi:MAG: 2-amino-4-hydroxy-6-hydroxymethyldihydropteridine diphosphokinase [Alphaproteobacteria bacterium]|nr:2-amino-4-hydroxy-6-hydroxymethyldihydropteridine diphosphokinase [Alphaproteobacteria bacterium]